MKRGISFLTSKGIKVSVYRLYKVLGIVKRNNYSNPLNILTFPPLNIHVFIFFSTKTLICIHNFLIEHPFIHISPTKQLKFLNNMDSETCLDEDHHLVEVSGFAAGETLAGMEEIIMQLADNLSKFVSQSS